MLSGKQTLLHAVGGSQFRFNVKECKRWRDGLAAFLLLSLTFLVPFDSKMRVVELCLIKLGGFRFSYFIIVLYIIICSTSQFIGNPELEILEEMKCFIFCCYDMQYAPNFVTLVNLFIQQLYIQVVWNILNTIYQRVKFIFGVFNTVHEERVGHHCIFDPIYMLTSLRSEQQCFSLKSSA